MSELVYLCVPYSHPSDLVQEDRYNAANHMASKLMLAGIPIFSPISHSRPIALAGGLPHDYAFWKRWNHACLDACGAMIVLRLEGWQESKGVAGECAYMDQLLRPIYYLDQYNNYQFRVLVAVLTKAAIADAGRESLAEFNR